MSIFDKIVTRLEYGEVEIFFLSTRTNPDEYYRPCRITRTYLSFKKIIRSINLFPIMGNVIKTVCLVTVLDSVAI